MFGFLVELNATSLEFLNLFFASLKNSSSFGLEPSQPPSIYAIPKVSRADAIFNLSSTENDIPAP